MTQPIRPTEGAYAPELTPQWVARTLKLALPSEEQHGDRPYTTVTTDSRKVVPGSLFVAIPGERFDGHDFIDAVIEQGARGILHGKGRGPSPRAGVACFAVEDTVQAYRSLGGAWRKEFSIPVICVAGSVGKTTTKELLASILSAQGPVLKTEGSQNGFVGIPMTLLELRAAHRAAVVEVGIDEIGAMAQHLPIVHPTISLLTAIGPEHLEKLIDLPTVAREEGEALSWVDRQGADPASALILNLDDPWIRPHTRTLRHARMISISLEGREGAGESIQGQWDETRQELAIPAWSVTLKSPLPGVHNARNLLIAAGAAHAVGLDPATIAKGLATFKGAQGRSQLRELPQKSGKPVRVLCDYYNANPTSVEAALQVIETVSQGQPGDVWISLGDMLELGAGEEQLHRELAQPLLKLAERRSKSGSKVHVLLYGKRMAWLADELATQRYSERTQGRIETFLDHSALASRLIAQAPGAAALLIKGSRSMKMETVWEQLLSAAPL